MMILKHRFIYLVVIFLALQLLILSHAKAEYRVYKLGVTYEPGQTEVEVLTTLDDQQYETYYKISANQVTRIIDHWMCLGRTDNFMEYCDKPITNNAQNQNQDQSQPQTQAQGDIPAPSKN